MAFQLSPGVNVTERDLTTIVPSVATTSAGFVGLFEWGPVGLPVLVSTVQEYGALFGLPRDGNYEYWFTGYNYLGYGNNLKIVRCVDETVAKNATPGGLTAALVKVPSNAESVVVGTNGAFVGRYAGELGNSLWVEMCGGATAVGSAGVSVELVASRGATWLYATNKDGKVLFSGMLRIGSLEIFIQPEQVNLRVGNAGAVDISVNGEDVGSIGANDEVVNLTYNADQLNKVRSAQ